MRRVILTILAASVLTGVGAILAPASSLAIVPPIGGNEQLQCWYAPLDDPTIIDISTTDPNSTLFMQEDFTDCTTSTLTITKLSGTGSAGLTDCSTVSIGAPLPASFKVYGCTGPGSYSVNVITGGIVRRTYPVTVVD